MWLVFVLISATSWAIMNVLDSLLVKHYEKSPVVLMWSQSLFSVVSLCVLAVLFPVRTEWYPLLLAMGVVAYCGDLFFFYILDRLDISVVNAAWALLSLSLSIAGFVFFHESWTPLQSAGAVLIIASVLFLSFWHIHVSLLRTIVLLSAMALIQTPYYIVKKAAIGSGVFPVFFWLLLSRELLAFTFPWFVSSYRHRIRTLPRIIDRKFFLIGGFVILFFFGGEYFGAQAFASGQLSLVSIVADVQPFLVILIAWVFARIVPSHAPRELLSAQSVFIKLLSFSGVFAGLALLALSH